MIADGLTKSLLKVKHIEFVKQLQIEDIRNRIYKEAILEDAKDRLQNQLESNRHDFKKVEKLGYKGGQKKKV